MYEQIVCFLLNQLSEEAQCCSFFLYDIQTLHGLRIYTKIFVINEDSEESKRHVAAK